MRFRAIVIAATGLLLGITGMALLQKTPSRNPASTHKAKWIPQESAKHLAALKVELSTEKAIPESSDAEVTLIGKITLQQNAQSEVTYSWTLPEGVEVLEGDLSDSFPNVTAGKTIEVKLIVSGFSKEKQSLIALQSSVIASGVQLGGSAVITSRPEDTWEAVAPQMQQAAEENLGVEAFHGRRK
ncbi:hypothetical protein [Bdellovibrio svalbardensis]|uniref:Uncharacterized protein n=1 Tax=Bdellovibrio svalbardensis TaxID=2972972 RepID=A0ABT6DFY0_9BACT|nr:hypothetical protein [Bdellovibrio svalbardensis]MDG0814771.1 hypothetical protein [Bdellovibrio svalbardensis]